MAKHPQRLPSRRRPRHPNPSGVGRRQVQITVGVGIVVGLLSGVLLRAIGDHAWRGLWTTMLPVLAAVLAGATLGAGGVLLLTQLLDRWRPWGDPLLGFSGMMRLLWHAGELSLLGAVSAGIGSGVGGLLGSTIGGAAAGLVLGGAVYRLRGLGTALGAEAGAVAGAIGGFLGALLEVIV
jgi:hypothetical protein